MKDTLITHTVKLLHDALAHDIFAIIVTFRAFIVNQTSCHQQTPDYEFARTRIVVGSAHVTLLLVLWLVLTVTVVASNFLIIHAHQLTNVNYLNPVIGCVQEKLKQ